LTLTGEFGPDATRGEKLRHRLRGLVRELEMVDLIELKPEFVRRQQLQRQEADYRLMLSICSLLLQCRMPTETAGSDKVPGLDQEAMILWRVFETFVANFYRCHLTDWTVSAQPVFKWHESRTSPFLPVMRPDVVLTHPASATMIVLDTKFSAGSLTTGRWGGWRFQ
jgi:5-methylcytosine-specific restriction enzyme subunit McrC